MPLVSKTQRLGAEERRERTTDLFARAAATDGAVRAALIDEVIEINLQIADAVARRFQNRGIPLDDLEQVAAMALVRAAQNFDLSHDRDFLSYAVPTMSGELKRHFRDLGWTIRPPRRIQEIHARVYALYEGGRDDGTAMRVEEIAAVVEVPVSDVEEALAARGIFQPSSLDQVALGDPDSASGVSMLELLRDDGRDLEEADARVLLEPVLRQLSERDRRILQLRFVEDQTQAEIGEELGVTQMQVSRLLTRILKDMRNKLEPASE